MRRDGGQDLPLAFLDVPGKLFGPLALDPLDILHQDLREVRIEPDLRHYRGVNRRTEDFLGIAGRLRCSHHAICGTPTLTLLMIAGHGNALLAGLLIEDPDIRPRRLVTQPRVLHGRVPLPVRIARAALDLRVRIQCCVVGS